MEGPSVVRVVRDGGGGAWGVDGPEGLAWRVMVARSHFICLRAQFVHCGWLSSH